MENTKTIPCPVFHLLFPANPNGYPVESSYLMRFAVVFALLVVLPACGPLPKPFRHQGDNANPLTRLDDAAGVVVMPVTGGDRSAGKMLAEALAAALRDAAIPAGLGPGNQQAKRLTGTLHVTDLAQGTSLLAITWLIRGPDGAVLAEVGQREDVPRAAWKQADAGIMAFVAGKAAAMLGPDLRQDYGPVTRPVKRPAAVVLWPITDAPGDGNNALTRAMREALGARDVVIYRDVTDSIPILICEVSVVPESSMADRVNITWIILETDGREVGRLAQSNTVERGRLEAGWGSVAFLVAQAGAEALADILLNMANDPERLVYTEFGTRYSPRAP